MAVKVFNNRSTFRLDAPDGTFMIVPPMGFCEIPDKFTGDITFKMAVKAGVMQVFETAKQGAKLEEAAHTAKPQAKEQGQAQGEAKPQTKNQTAVKPQAKATAKGDKK